MLKNSLAKRASHVAILSGIMLTPLVAKADCFDTAYGKYVGYQRTTYTIAGKRDSDLQTLYSGGVFAAESGTSFRSGERGSSSWTGYNLQSSLSSFATVASMFVRLDFTTRSIQLSVPAWGYNQWISASCSGDVIQAYDGLNTWLLSLYGSNVN